MNEAVQNAQETGRDAVLASSAAYHGLRGRIQELAAEAAGRKADSAGHEADVYNELGDHAFDAFDASQLSRPSGTSDPLNPDPRNTHPVRPNIGRAPDEANVASAQANGIAMMRQARIHGTMDPSVWTAPTMPSTYGETPGTGQQRRGATRITRNVQRVEDLRKDQERRAKIFGDQGPAAPWLRRWLKSKDYIISGIDYREGTIDAHEKEQRRRDRSLLNPTKRTWAERTTERELNRVVSSTEGIVARRAGSAEKAVIRATRKQAKKEAKAAVQRQKQAAAQARRQP